MLRSVSFTATSLLSGPKAVLDRQFGRPRHHGRRPTTVRHTGGYGAANASGSGQLHGPHWWLSPHQGHPGSSSKPVSPSISGRRTSFQGPEGFRMSRDERPVRHSTSAPPRATDVPGAITQRRARSSRRTWPQLPKNLTYAKSGRGSPRCPNPMPGEHARSHRNEEESE